MPSTIPVPLDTPTIAPDESSDTILEIEAMRLTDAERLRRLMGAALLLDEDA